MGKKIKVPKKIAGVKIPKGIRKGAVVKFLNTPPGQVVLAQVLLMIGGAFALKSEAVHPVDAMKRAKHDIDGRAGDIAAKLTRAFAAAAHSFRDVMESSQEEMPLAGSSSAAREREDRDRKKSAVRSETRARPH